MPIKSYIAIPLENQGESLSMSIKNLSYCEIYPSTNREVLVLVTDTPDEETERRLMEQVEALPSLLHLTLISGFTPELIDNL